MQQILKLAEDYKKKAATNRIAHYRALTSVRGKVFRLLKMRLGGQARSDGTIDTVIGSHTSCTGILKAHGAVRIDGAFDGTLALIDSRAVRVPGQICKTSVIY